VYAWDEGCVAWVGRSARETEKDRRTQGAREGERGRKKEEEKERGIEREGK